MSYILRKIIDVDLTKNTISIKKLEENLFKNYLGGSGIAAKLLYDELQPIFFKIMRPKTYTVVFSPLSFPRTRESISLSVIARPDLSGRGILY